MSYDSKILVPPNTVINVAIAKDQKQRQLGLSYVKDHQLKSNQGMFFIYEHKQILSFWMPNTYIDLDIFFLDEKFNVIAIERNMKKHLPKALGKPQNTKRYFAKYVLELRSDSKISKNIKIGSSLKIYK